MKGTEMTDFGLQNETLHLYLFVLYLYLRFIFTLVFFYFKRKNSFRLEFCRTKYTIFILSVYKGQKILLINYLCQVANG